MKMGRSKKNKIGKEVTTKGKVKLKNNSANEVKQAKQVSAKTRSTNKHDEIALPNNELPNDCVPVGNSNHENEQEYRIDLREQRNQNYEKSKKIEKGKIDFARKTVKQKATEVKCSNVNTDKDIRLAMVKAKIPSCVEGIINICDLNKTPGTKDGEEIMVMVHAPDEDFQSEELDFE